MTLLDLMSGLVQCIVSKIEIQIFDIQALISLFKYFLVCKYILKLSELRLLVDVAHNWYGSSQD